jgi:hypothetical protein
MGAAIFGISRSSGVWTARARGLDVYLPCLDNAGSRKGVQEAVPCLRVSMFAL